MMLGFCLRSMARQYGWAFLRRVAVPHPIRTARAVWRASRLDSAGDEVRIDVETEETFAGGHGALVGVGFCMKPLDPPCPSGRFNHDCLYLERVLGTGAEELPRPCRECAIRRVGTRALAAGAAFYIMTSAHDILLDVFDPAIRERRFTSGVFVLCRYSFEPFAAGMIASEMHGRMLAFRDGDCRDYATWVRADRGDKDEQTRAASSTERALDRLLSDASHAPSVTRRGNVLYPEHDLTQRNR